MTWVTVEHVRRNQNQGMAKNGHVSTHEIVKAGEANELLAQQIEFLQVHSLVRLTAAEFQPYQARQARIRGLVLSMDTAD